MPLSSCTSDKPSSAQNQFSQNDPMLRLASSLTLNRARRLRQLKTERIHYKRRGNAYRIQGYKTIAKLTKWRLLNEVGKQVLNRCKTEKIMHANAPRTSKSG